MRAHGARAGLPKLIPKDPDVLDLGRRGERRRVPRRANSICKGSEVGASRIYRRSRGARKGWEIRGQGRCGRHRSGPGQMKAGRREKSGKRLSFSLDVATRTHKQPVSIRAEVRTQNPSFPISS